MVHFIPFFEPAQDRNGVFHGRLIDEDRLKAPFKRGIFFDMFPVFVERRRADEVQFASRQHRLQQIGRVHRAFGRTGPDDRMQFIDEQKNLTLGRLNFFQDGFQPLLEFAAKLAPATSAPMSSATSFSA